MIFGMGIGLRAFGRLVFALFIINYYYEQSYNHTTTNLAFL